MRIYSFNINSVNARLPLLLRFLETYSPDILCLQELKCTSAQFPFEEIEKAGYSALVNGQKSWNGVAVLSKNHDLELRSDTLEGDTSDTQSRYLELLTGQLILCCIYVPNGNPLDSDKYTYKLQWLQRLAARMEALITMERPVLIVGDYNIIPTEKDVYKPEKYLKNALFTEEVREKFQEILQQGWTDALKDSGEYTFWDYFRNAYGRDAGMRIDHILFNEQLKDRVLSAGVLREVRGWDRPSDHAPVWIELK